ncbi:MAG TPA: ATP-binding protein, partial [Trichocoleus sp.]
ASAGISKGLLGEEADLPGQDSPVMTGDPDQITRLFTNLISNAVQYTPGSGTVQITLQPIRQQGHLCLQVTVRDTGIGIAADALGHVFDRFYRADPARSRGLHGGAGSGLGLAIAKAIVDNHKGQIRIDSQPSQGTTVTVLLPKTLSPIL